MGTHRGCVISKVRDARTARLYHEHRLLLLPLKLLQHLIKPGQWLFEIPLVIPVDGPRTRGEGDDEDGEGDGLMFGNATGNVEFEDDKHTNRGSQWYQDEFIPPFESVKTQQHVAPE